MVPEQAARRRRSGRAGACIALPYRGRSPRGHLSTTFYLRGPDDEVVGRFLAANEATPLSYAAVGCTRAPAPPPGFQVDHVRVRLGEGEDAWRAAVAALGRWEMFRLGWVRVFPPNADQREGSTVAVTIAHLGFYSLHACRVVFREEEHGDVERHGFAYGTTLAHAECGEERFLVEWDRQSDVVSYDLVAISRPAHPLARLGYPFTRWLQGRFREHSVAAMVQAVRG